MTDTHAPRPEAPERITVRYYHEQPGLCTGNIIWAERNLGSAYYRVSQFAMKSGRFPTNHPCAPGEAHSNKNAEFGDSESLRTFRARGYWASCFPEGDGITLRCARNQTPETVVQDIADCFGWRVKVQR